MGVVVPAYFGTALPGSVGTWWHCLLCKCAGASLSEAPRETAQSKQANEAGDCSIADLAQEAQGGSRKPSPAQGPEGLTARGRRK